MGPEERRTHSTSAFELPSVSWTTRDEAVRFPIYDSNSKDAVRAPPQQPEPMGLNKPSRKEACPKMSRYQPAFRPMFAFRPAPMPTRRPCLPGVHAHLTPMLSRRSVSTGTHTHLASVFRSAPIFARWSYFDRCPCPPGAHTHPTSLFCQAPMLA